jgi:hypothetical protein
MKRITVDEIFEAVIRHLSEKPGSREAGKPGSREARGFEACGLPDFQASRLD